MNRHSRRRLASSIGILALGLVLGPAAQTLSALSPAWTAPQSFRVLLTADARGKVRSNSPAAVEVDFQSLLGQDQAFDSDTIQVFALDANDLVPCRLDGLFGSTKSTLNFVMPVHTCSKYAVYFDTVQSGLGNPKRYPGLVGDGDRFCEEFQRREIAASHFDQFVDFDADGDLDLLQGGVEPYVECFENVGEGRLEPRGRLANEGKLFALPHSDDGRSWLTIAFYDIDGDGDQDFCPSFNDGPDRGRFVLYRNTTRPGGDLTFARAGVLQTVSGTALAGGAQAGGWFPSIAFVAGWDGDEAGRLDAIVGSNHRGWLYRGLGTAADGSPRFGEAEALQAGGQEIELVNPRFDAADLDDDGDLDLVAGTQPGPICLFENRGTRTRPELAAGRILALEGKYLIGDAHSGAKIADFDADGLLDLAAGRFWERTDLRSAHLPRKFGGLFRNIGSHSLPRFEAGSRGAPFTERFQICDAIRQNSVRAVDWNGDGQADLLAGDTDGFVWLFRNQANHRFPVFAPGEKLQAGDAPLSVTEGGGHARLDVCDWNEDGSLDLVVADGNGGLSLFGGVPAAEGAAAPVLSAGQRLLADGKPIQGGARSSVVVCDWDNDGRKDVVFADADGYRWHRNVGAKGTPELAASAPVLFGGRNVSYVRPNLGSFVDWDGDGRRDLLGCGFENNIRWYRNLGQDAAGAEPQFADPEGVVILQASSPQMISGADAVDWNADGDLDLLTGQGHGGSGLRFFERDWIEDELADTHPIVTIEEFQTRPTE